MRRSATFGIWLLGTMAAVLMTVQGVRVVTDQVLGERPAPLSALQIRSELAVPVNTTALDDDDEGSASAPVQRSFVGTVVRNTTDLLLDLTTLAGVATITLAGSETSTSASFEVGDLVIATVDAPSGPLETPMFPPCSTASFRPGVNRYGEWVVRAQTSGRSATNQSLA